MINIWVVGWDFKGRFKDNVGREILFYSVVKRGGMIFLRVFFYISLWCLRIGGGVLGKIIYIFCVVEYLSFFWFYNLGKIFVI